LESRLAAGWILIGLRVRRIEKGAEQQRDNEEARSARGARQKARSFETLVGHCGAPEPQTLAHTSVWHLSGQSKVPCGDRYRAATLLRRRLETATQQPHEERQGSSNRHD
jgi:hypothetical protein